MFHKSLLLAVTSLFITPLFVGCAPLFVGCAGKYLLPWLPQLHSQTKPVHEWIFHPDYQLPGNAANHPGPRNPLPTAQLAPVTTLAPPLLLHGQKPTERIPHLLHARDWPKGNFSVEMWLVNHVNQPIGIALSMRDDDRNSPFDWMLSYYGNEIRCGIKDMGDVSSKIDRGWKRYWMQVVATFARDSVRLYYNGVLKETLAMPADFGRGDQASLEVSAYLANEPYMQTANLLKRLAVYDGALPKTEIDERRAIYQEEVEKGKLFPQLFHFNAGPYLHFATPTSINIGWETSQALRSATLHYGEEVPLKIHKNIELGQDPGTEPKHFIQTITLDGLEPRTPYFYELEAVSTDGDTIRSGILTFATAPDGPEPFTFAVIGDTEARPHVNFQIAGLVWDERPNFIVNLGDLTDGGKEPHKFEWTHEYFAGMTPLTSRIPVFPVAGNGEGDLYWYNRYHKLPAPEAYYTFDYGNAQFFMLNSNQRQEEFAPGGRQYVWLEEQLKNSDAAWKFVCHHHAPYSSDENDYGDSWSGKSNLGDPAVRPIVPLYEKYGVDIVFFGHLHTYQRTLPVFSDIIDRKNGVIYLQGGGAGGNLEDFTPNRSWFSAKTYRGHHYFTISIFDEELQMKMYDSNGNMKDFMELKK